MPWGFGPSVNRYGRRDEGPDCWRTWFLEECEANNLFGVTSKYLKLLTLAAPTVSPYHAGTQIFLEDAPYFHQSRNSHKLCGPYTVLATKGLTEGSTAEHVVGGDIIVYREARPELGPWLDRSVSREIEGLRVRFRQMATRYQFYPYRFSIRQGRNFRVEFIQHLAKCWLCQ